MAIKHSRHDGALALLDKIDDKVGLLDDGALNAPDFSGKQIGIPSDPTDGLVVTSQYIFTTVAAPRQVVIYRAFEILEDLG